MTRPVSAILPATLSVPALALTLHYVPQKMAAQPFFSKLGSIFCFVLSKVSFYPLGRFGIKTPAVHDPNMLRSCTAGAIFQALDNRFILCYTLLEKKEEPILLNNYHFLLIIILFFYTLDQHLTKNPIVTFPLYAGFK
ncbi:MAG: hypothetical protein GY860_26410 [Desulfobacteraceae bacterium]|nr:hypothetical protein [Desulfobacteraceae bacterium]